MSAPEKAHTLLPDTGSRHTGVRIVQPAYRSRVAHRGSQFFSQYFARVPGAVGCGGGVRDGRLGAGSGEFNFALSPSCNYLLFSFGSKEVRNLYAVATTAPFTVTNLTRWTKGQYVFSQTLISPDGRLAVFAAGPSETSSSLMAVPIRGGGRPRTIYKPAGAGRRVWELYGMK